MAATSARVARSPIALRGRPQLFHGAAPQEERDHVVEDQDAERHDQDPVEVDGGRELAGGRGVTWYAAGVILSPRVAKYSAFCR